MANIPLQSITFPGLADKYTTPTVDSTLTQTGAAADAKKTGDEIAELKNDLNQKADKTEALSAYIVETETGSIASFTDGADSVPVKDLTVAIEPVQSGSGDPSPSNVRPISGWTGANVTANGINQWDEEWEIGSINAQDGSNANTTTQIRSKNYIPCLPNTSYFLNSSMTGNDIRIAYYGIDKTFIVLDAWQYNGVFTTRSRAYYMRFYVAGSYGTTYNHDISINYPSTDTAYHAYKGSSVSIDWTTEAGTVYGGTLDVTTGVLTVDRAIEYIRDKTWEINSGRMETVLNSAFNADDRASSISSAYVYNINILGQNPENYSGCFAQVTSSRRLLLYDDRYTTSDDITDFVTDMGDTSFVYKLATPQTYQLTPEEVKTVLGQNNIFADTGNVTVQYHADTKLYIDKVLNA